MTEVPASHFSYLVVHSVHQSGIGRSNVLLGAQAGKTPWLGHPLNASHHTRILEVLCVCVSG